MKSTCLQYIHQRAETDSHSLARSLLICFFTIFSACLCIVVIFSYSFFGCTHTETHLVVARTNVVKLVVCVQEWKRCESTRASTGMNERVRQRREERRNVAHRSIRTLPRWLVKMYILPYSSFVWEKLTKRAESDKRESRRWFTYYWHTIRPNQCKKSWAVIKSVVHV